MTQQIPDRFVGGAVDLSHLAAANQQLPGAAVPAGTSAPGESVPVPALILDVTDQSFEQVAQLSAIVPVVIDLWAEWCQPCKTLGPILEKLALEYEGRILLAKVDVDANPGLAQAFQAQSIPTVVALVAGRPVPLFQGAIPEAQVREVFAQLVRLGEQQGLAGRVHIAGEEGAAEPLEAPVNPAHEAALAAIELGDYATAITEYEQVLAKAPADHEAHAALMQVRLLHRLQGKGAEEIRQAAAANPSDAQAQMLVADLDVAGGHVEDSFLRLLDLFAASTEPGDRTAIRERLLELFEVVGTADPRVALARGRLASLLY